MLKVRAPNDVRTNRVSRSSFRWKQTWNQNAVSQPKVEELDLCSENLYKVTYQTDSRRIQHAWR